MVWQPLCPLERLAPEEPVGVQLGSVALCAVRHGMEVLVVHDECTHQAVPLSEGDVEGGRIECWRHGSRFDLRTGQPVGPPAVVPVQTYLTRIVDGVVEVNLE